MKKIYLIILLCTFCANEKIVTKASTTPNFLTILNATNPMINSSCSMKQQPVDSILPKQKLMVTFLTNSKSKDSINYNNDIMEPPFFVDPFSRLLQYFFASIMSDVSRPFEENDKQSSTSEFEIFSSNNSNTDLDLISKQTTKTKMSCPHGLDGFCPNCHSLFKENKSNNKTGIKDKRNKTMHTTEKANQTHFFQEIQIFQKPKHKRQYFLSISGDTEKRVTAPIITSDNKRIKRDSFNAKANSQDNRQSFLKILEETIYGKINKDERHNETSEILWKLETSANPDDEENEPVTTVTQPATDLHGQADDHDDHDHDLYDFGIYPHEADNSQGWHYFFIVTLPVSCTFAVIIFFLCICLRTRGWCCNLFLKDPTKTLEEKNNNTKIKHRKIAHKKINIDYT